MQTVSSHMKRCSTSLIIRKMQTKTTMRYHPILVRMAIIKKNTNSKCWWGCGEKRTLIHSWWESKFVHPLWKTIWRFLKKLKIVLLYDSPIPILGIYLKKTKTLIWKDTCTPMFIATLSVISKIWKHHKCPLTNEWTKKIHVCIHTHTHTHTEWNTTEP